jgi:DNA-binding Lrp family transcriptional regulator
MQAYVLVNAEQEKLQDVYEIINGLEDVADAHVVFGEWDIVARVQAENLEALGTLILDKIRPIPGVTLSSTLTIAR